MEGVRSLAGKKQKLNIRRETAKATVEEKFRPIRNFSETTCVKAGNEYEQEKNNE